MPPLVMLAGTLLPEILRLFASDKSNTIGDKVTDVFKSVLKTDDLSVAEQKIAASPSDRAEIQLQLAQIAANEAEAQREAEEARRRFELEVLQDKLAESERIREAEFRRYQVDAADRSQARERLSKLEEADSPFAYVPPILALIITLGLGYFLYLLLTTHNELQNKDVFNTILGALTTAFVTIVTFYFGSSVGSKEKDQLITSGQLVPSGSGQTVGGGSGGSLSANEQGPAPNPSSGATSGPVFPSQVPQSQPGKSDRLPPPTGPLALFRSKAPKIIRQLMSDFGLTDFQAAGVVGNLGHESSGFRKLQEIRPLIAGSRGGWGWAQWTGDRRDRFEQWATSRGYNFSSDEANYGFLRIELNGQEGAGVIPSLHAARDLSSATEVFMTKFERPSARYAGLDSRLHYAEVALDEYRRA